MILALINSIVPFLGLQALFLWPTSLVRFFTLTAMVCLALSMWLIVRTGWTFWKSALIYLPTPLILMSSSFAFVIFLSDPTLRNIFSGFLVMVNFVYWRNIFNKTQSSGTGLIVNFLTGFLFYCSLFGGQIFLGYNTFVLGGVALAGTFFLMTQALHLFDNQLEKNWLSAALASLLLGESFVVISYLPTGYFENATALMAIYYLVTNLFASQYSGQLTLKGFAKYIAISLLILALIYLTAGWL